jgi:hypothetical protein
LELAIAELSQERGRATELLLLLLPFSRHLPHLTVRDVSVETPFDSPSFQLPYTACSRCE